MATFLVSRTRLAGVDAWEAERVAQVSVEAARRRDEHRGADAPAGQGRLMAGLPTVGTGRNGDPTLL